MELLVFVGLQASGKSTYFVRHYLRSHLLLSLDVLRTRARERLLLEAALRSRTKIVVDNTNPTAQDRARYVGPALAAGYTVRAVVFDVPVAECVRRNEGRPAALRVPRVAILRTARLLQRPTVGEGFAEIRTVNPGTEEAL